jgi:hypothetical protein
MTWCLKAGIVGLKRLPLLGSSLINVPAAIDMHATIEELLEAVFPMHP